MDWLATKAMEWHGMDQEMPFWARLSCRRAKGIESMQFLLAVVSGLVTKRFLSNIQKAFSGSELGGILK
jgi:hypothetical protein